MRVFYNNGTEEWVLSDGRGNVIERVDAATVREYQEQSSAEFTAAAVLLLEEHVNSLEHASLDLLKMLGSRNVLTREVNNMKVAWNVIDGWHVSSDDGTVLSIVTEDAVQRRMLEKESKERLCAIAVFMDVVFENLQSMEDSGYQKWLVDELLRVRA